MIEFNWKRVILILILALLLIGTMVVVAVKALTYEEYQQLYVKGVNAPMGSANGSIEVRQRDTVYWGDTVDLSLVSGWTDKLLHAQTGKIVDISSFQHRILIDPEVFPVGEWDQWSDFDERHGNTVAFFVEKERPESEIVSPLETPNVTTLKPYIQPLPLKHVSDVLVARGDPLNIAFKSAKVWIFGSSTGLYGFETINNTIALNISQVRNLQPGTYTMVVEEPGNVTPSFTMRYVPEEDRIEYFDAQQFRILTVEMRGLDPLTRLAKFRDLQKLTTDKFTEYKIVVENPRIDVASIDTTYINDTTFSQTIKGYTNAAIGTQLTFIIDKEKQTSSSLKYSTFYSSAEGSAMKPGDMRWFEMTVPLLWGNYGTGHHTVTVSSSIGGETSVGFDVYEAPAHSYIPNNTIKYVNGSEWRPDPTPRIIEKTVTKEIIKVVTKEIPVPPPQESVDEAQYKANVKVATLIGSLVIGVIVAVIVGLYSYSLACRLRERKGKGGSE